MNSISMITGGSRGLGRSTALNLARLGNDVVITYQTRESEAQEVVAQVQAMQRKAVVASTRSWEQRFFSCFCRATQFGPAHHLGSEYL